MGLSYLSNKLSVIAIMLLLANIIQAQFIVELGPVDKAQFSAMNTQLGSINAQLANSNASILANHARELEQLTKAASWVEKQKRKLDTINNVIEQGYQLKRNIEDMYYQVSQFDGLSVADATYFFEKYTGVTLDPAGLLPNIPETAQARAYLNKANPRYSTLKYVDIAAGKIENTVKLYSDNSSEFRLGDSVLVDSLLKAQTFVRSTITTQKEIDKNMMIVKLEMANQIESDADTLTLRALELKKLANLTEFRASPSERAVLLAQASQMDASAVQMRVQAIELRDSAHEEILKAAMENQRTLQKMKGKTNSSSNYRKSYNY